MTKKIYEEDSNSKKINEEDTKKINTEDEDFKHRHFQHASSNCYLYTVGIRQLSQKKRNKIDADLLIQLENHFAG